jgi:hypothetical protein
LLFTSVTFLSQNCDIKKSYKDLFAVEKHKIRDTIILSKTINTDYKKGCFSDLTTKYPLYTRYLLRHFTNRNYMPKLIGSKDSLSMQRKFIKFLKKDTKLDSVMTRLSDKLLQKAEYKDSIVSFNDVLDVAVKFFYFHKNKRTGKNAAHICIGLNGIKETEPIHKPFLEAFAFQTIMSHIDDGTYNMFDLYIKEMKKLRPLNLGTKENEKLYRIQGAIYAVMFQNKKLKELLIKSYLKNQAILPFKIKDLPKPKIN